MAMPEMRRLSAGPLSILFQPEDGFVRYIRWGTDEVLRGLYVAVRDHNWDTVAPRVHGLDVEEAADSFTLKFTVDHRLGGIDYQWDGRIEGHADGRFLYSMQGRVRSDFRRNRIGFCVLHAPECAGKACRVLHVDGSSTEGAFPRSISPHQPFFNIRSIAHDLEGGARVDVRMEGDSFEMEDQRNWTDASYKTYCTPLAEPFPVAVTSGDTVSQRIRVTITGESPALPTDKGDADGSVELRVNAGDRRALPKIGLQATAREFEPLPEVQAERIAALAPDFLRSDIPLYEDDGHPRWLNACDEADRLDIPLQAALFVGDEPEDELMALREWWEGRKPVRGVLQWLLFHRDEKSTGNGTLRTARTHLRAIDPSAPLVGGTDAFFTELNRGRPDAALLDAVTFSLTPNYHAFDDLSMVETLPMQAEVVRCARQIVSGKPVIVSPVSLRARWNPNATGPEPDPDPGELPSTVDARQSSRYAALWTLGSVKYLTDAGADSVTFYETVGWRGLQEVMSGSPIPGKFVSLPGEPFPVLRLLERILSLKRAASLAVESSDPLAVIAIVLSRSGGERVLVANFSASGRPIHITGLEQRQVVASSELAGGGTEQAAWAAVRCAWPRFDLGPRSLRSIDLVPVPKPGASASEMRTPE